ncbi:hypothetical protein ABXS71_12500 [Bacillus infantis]|uniref:hypothetical protein n=1 Tax=Bacillus infantis TaxID=324767 RepID=UPI00344E734D
MKKLFPLYILLPLLLMACRIQEEPAAELPDYKPSKDDIVSMHETLRILRGFYRLLQIYIKAVKTPSGL